MCLHKQPPDPQADQERSFYIPPCRRQVRRRRSRRSSSPPSDGPVTRWDCININNEPVSEQDFLRVENHFVRMNEREQINASEFELLTATAFTLFNEKQVDVGIIEVGMGGKLDATNILNNQIVSVISKIAHDHQAFLGDTLDEIALHKAGILRPEIPYLVNPMNDHRVQEVVDRYANEIGAGPRILTDSQELIDTVFKSKAFRKFADELLPFQRDNAVLAFLAYIQVLKSSNLNADLRRAVNMLAKLKNKKTLPGRQELMRVPLVFGQIGKQRVLIDGAHNEDAADALKDFVHGKIRLGTLPPRKQSPIVWVIAMTEGRDPCTVLQRLLRPGDGVIATSFGPVDGMPWIKSMSSEILLNAAQEVCPGIVGLAVPERGAYRALCAAKYLSQHISPRTRFVLTGSLYFVGDFFREHRAGMDADQVGRLASIFATDSEERSRIEEFFGKTSTPLSNSSPSEIRFSMQRPRAPARQRSLSVNNAFERSCDSNKASDSDSDTSANTLHSSHPQVKPVYIRKQQAKSYEQIRLERRNRRSSANDVSGN